MSLDTLKERLPDYARDIKLNLGSVLTTQGAPGLSEKQIAALALSTAIASRNAELTAAIETWATPQLDVATIAAAKAAAAVMAMNNIYYRFLHLVEKAEYQTLPARLRMNVIGNPGIDKLDFELLSLAVSAVNGCGMCITAHEKKLRAGGIDMEAIQSAVRIASVIHAAAVTLEYQAAA
ncbi:MAG: carboxymuconolactone decarboxylase family protein [Candidatus Obscuribacterales bacterium]|nr:carboxymuconolactone decarboxylase family protein [Steroidobacteraceae bacterium]